VAREKSRTGECVTILVSESNITREHTADPLGVLS
jgi:hypothetical protein